jgi:hypothetical protein
MATSFRATLDGPLRRHAPLGDEPEQDAAQVGREIEGHQKVLLLMDREVQVHHQMAREQTR